MSVIGISMCRNEIDVAPYVVRNMLVECDALIIADNGSTDGTRELLEALAGPDLILVDEPRFGYRQAETMNRLAGVAMEMGAEWCVPFDFDEWWDSADGRIADVLATLPAGLEATGTRTWDMVPQPSDEPGPNPFRRIVMTRPGSLWARPESRKCAYRPGPGRVLCQGNHGLEGRPLPDFGPLRVRHFPFRSFEQAKAKLRHGRLAAEASGLGPGYGAHWLEWGAYPDEELGEWWRQWTDSAGLVQWTG